MVALPFCHVELRAAKPISKAYPLELKALGDHIRKRRLDLGLLQKDVARIFESNSQTVTNWEKNNNYPSIEFIPRIIAFLGYVPFESIPRMSLGEKIKICRKIKGISQERLARLLGFDPSTVAQWERDDRLPSQPYLEALNAFLAPIVSEASEAGGRS